MQTLEFEKKILLIGDGSVGKTSLVRRFVIDKFDDKYIVTIGTKTSRKPMEFDFPDHEMKIHLMLDIWDILGQSGMERAHKVYFKGAESYIVVFDGTRRASFESLPNWIRSVSELAGHIPGVLAGNKVDLKESFQVTEPEAESMAKDSNLKLFWTSAKTGQNVEESFHEIGGYLCQPILKKYAGGAAAPEFPREKPRKKAFFRK